MELDGVRGVCGSVLAMPPFFFFFESANGPTSASSSGSMVSGSPDSIPSRVRRSSSRSFLNFRSFCLSFSSSR